MEGKYKYIIAFTGESIQDVANDEQFNDYDYLYELVDNDIEKPLWGGVKERAFEFNSKEEANEVAGQLKDNLSFGSVLVLPIDNKITEERLGNRTFTDADEAEYYRNKELYDYSGLASHREAMEKAKEACKEKGIEVDETRGVYESAPLPEIHQKPRTDASKDYNKIDIYVDGNYFYSTKAFPTIKDAIEDCKKEYGDEIEGRELNASFADKKESKATLHEKESLLTEEENKSFEDIIDDMSLADDYEDLRDAASYIVDIELKNKVYEMIDQCEKDGDEVDVAYSLISSDLLDPMVNELNETKSLTEQYSEKIGGDPQDFVSDVNTIINKLKEIDTKSLATHLSEEMLLDFIQTCESNISLISGKYHLTEGDVHYLYPTSIDVPIKFEKYGGEPFTADTINDMVGKYTKIHQGYHKILSVEPFGDNKYIIDFAYGTDKIPGGEYEPATLDEINKLQLYVEIKGEDESMNESKIVEDNDNINKITYQEMKDMFYKINENHEPTKYGVIVFTEDSFKKPYSLEARSYKVSSDNKAFKPDALGYSIYGTSLDESDIGVRLEQYMKDEYAGDEGWKVDYCYILDK